MLAKTPRKEEFSELLRIPPKPAAISEADSAWRLAVSEREAGQARHIEATRQLKEVPGQPPTITTREIEELAVALEPLFKAESEAAERRSSLREHYEQETNAFLTAAWTNTMTRSPMSWVNLRPCWE